MLTGLGFRGGLCARSDTAKGVLVDKANLDSSCHFLASMSFCSAVSPMLMQPTRAKSEIAKSSTSNARGLNPNPLSTEAW